LLFDPTTIGINIAAFQLVNGIAATAGSWLNPLMSILSESYYVVLLLVLVYLYLKKDKAIYAYIFSLVLLFAIGSGIKYAVAEPRPCSIPSLQWINMPNGCENSYSFPSDHAMVLTGVVLFLWRYRKAFALYAIWLLLVLFGRVYLGVHYFTDVLAGVALSLIIMYVIYRYSEKFYLLAKRLHLTILTKG
jgi:undecaprenyl-diphosphatase